VLGTPLFLRYEVFLKSKKTTNHSFKFNPLLHEPRLPKVKVKVHHYICLKAEAWKIACNLTYINKRGSVYDK